MRIIQNDCTDPAFNLALDEYLLCKCQGAFFMLWQNAPSVIIGRNQDALKEVNLDFLQTHGIRLVRRMSGGGAVFHDLGNINFSYILPCPKADFFNFARFAEPILAALKSLGLNAQMSGRNDLSIDGKKFSGNAQHMHGGRILHHGTLLFSSDFSYMTGALNVNPLKLVGKGVSSIKSRVINLQDCLSQKMSALEFKAYLQDFILSYFKGASLARLTGHQIDEVCALREQKYANEQWNLRHMPNFRIKNVNRFASGLVETAVLVSCGVIEDVRFFGDFFGINDIEQLERMLKGLPHSPSAVSAAIADIKLSDYISGIQNEQIIKLLF